MGDPSTLREALSLLGEVHREKRTGLLSIATRDDDLQVAVRDGRVEGICPLPGTPPAAGDPFSDPDDSARLKLEQVLVEVGLRRPRDSPRASGPWVGDLRERLVSSLALGGTEAGFDDTADLPPDALPVTGGTEPLILEAVRRIDDAEAIRGLLGNLDRGLTATPGLAHERTLTLTEGALLSRVDGVGTARQVLGSAPLEADDARRGLAGLLLTGRVRYESRPAPPEDEPKTSEPSPATAAPPLEGPEEGAARLEPSSPAPPGRDVPPESEFEPESPPPPQPDPQPAPGPEPGTPMSPELLAERKEILRLFESLPFLSHFEVLGLEPSCTDGEVRRAYVEQVKRHHPDAQREPALRDLHEAFEAIFIRVSEAWETLSDKESRAAYASRLGAESEDPGDRDAPSSAGGEEAGGDETLRKAERLLKETRFWDAIQILETAVPRLEPESRQHRGQLLLARAYAQNPKWVRRAEKALQRVVREDPANAEAHYELGVLYKSGGLSARAQAMFRRAVELRPGYPEAKAEMVTGDASPSGGFLRRLFKGGGTGA